MVNKNQIYRFLLQNGKVSNQEIASGLFLSVPTVLQNVNELIAEGLAEEAGYLESTGGRKAKAVSPLQQAYLSLGIDITRNHIGMVLLDLQGTVLQHERIPKPFCFEDAYFKELSENCRRFIDTAGISEEKILGAGISIPGIIDSTGLVIEKTDVLSLNRVDCSNFGRYLTYPCTYINDANAAGWAEYHALEHVRSAFYFSLSNSVGGAILNENGILPGDHVRSGEVGHITIEPDGDMCYCGKKGCFDIYGSAKRLEEEACCKLAEFFKRLPEGRESDLLIFERYLDYLAIAVNNVRMLLDCDIIIGGYVGCFMEPYLEELRKRAALRNTFEQDASYIKACKYKTEASAVGAALCQIENFIQKIQ